MWNVIEIPDTGLEIEICKRNKAFSSVPAILDLINPSQILIHLLIEMF